MSDYSSRMSEIELADAARYVARLAQEDTALGLNVPTTSNRLTHRGYPGKWAASRPRLRCHGAAAMPPTPEAAEDLANGLIPPTVLWTPRRGATERVEDLATFTSGRGRKDRQVREIAPHRTGAADLPALMAD